MAASEIDVPIYLDSRLGRFMENESETRSERLNIKRGAVSGLLLGEVGPRDFPRARKRGC